MVEQVLQSWDINGRVNAYFLEAVDEEVLWAKPPKGRTVGAQFGHVVSVRGAWIKSAKPELLGQITKVEDGSTKPQVLAALSESHQAMRKLLEEGLNAGRVKGFKPDAISFFAYLIAHEAHHRGQAELILRLLGKPIDDKVSYGIWEWNSRLLETETAASK